MMQKLKIFFNKILSSICILYIIFYNPYMNIIHSVKIDIYERIWTPPVTLENPTEHEGKSIEYTRMKLLE